MAGVGRRSGASASAGARLCAVRRGEVGRRQGGAGVRVCVLWRGGGIASWASKGCREAEGRGDRPAARPKEASSG